MLAVMETASRSQAGRRDACLPPRPDFTLKVLGDRRLRANESDSATPFTFPMKVYPYPILMLLDNVLRFGMHADPNPAQSILNDPATAVIRRGP